ncbi:MAG: hypothetical protein AAGG81_05850 [Chlamydiota bacterium]
MNFIIQTAGRSAASPFQPTVTSQCDMIAKLATKQGQSNSK